MKYFYRLFMFLSIVVLPLSANAADWGPAGLMIKNLQLDGDVIRVGVVWDGHEEVSTKAFATETLTDSQIGRLLAVILVAMESEKNIILIRDNVGKVTGIKTR